MIMLAVMPIFISSCSKDDDDDSNSESNTTTSTYESGKVGNYPYVDLGLASGTKWAIYNVGASAQSEYGDYFKWGAWGSALSAVSDSTTVAHDYNVGRILPASNDAATRNWGSNWRMPTNTEMKELINGCDWEWTKDFEGTGVAGEIGTSKANGKQIFFPAAGRTYLNAIQSKGDFGYYWTSEFDWSSAYDSYAFYFYYESTPESDSEDCGLGCTVRAVVK